MLKRWVAPSILLMLGLVACAGSPRPESVSAPAPASAAKPAAAPPPAEPTSPAPEPAGLPRTATVRVSTLASLSSAGSFVAEERGYFREEGIEVDETPIDTSTTSVTQLAGGHLDVASGGTAAGLYNAIAQGIAVRIVLNAVTAYPGNEAGAVIVRKALLDSGRFREPADLRGLRLAMTSRGHSTEMILDVALRAGGLTWADIDASEMPYPDMAVAIANNNLDAGVIIEPWAANAVRDGYGVRWKTWADLIPYDEVSVLMYSPKFADSQTEVARRYARAYLRGVRYYTDALTKGLNREDVIAMLQKRTALKDRAAYDYVPWPSPNPDGRVNSEAIAAAQDWFAARGYVPRTVDLSQVIDNRFADYILAELGPYQR
jgi:NitT/TauT family transport system substrate-binding protein